MSIHNLDKIFKPASVFAIPIAVAPSVIGACVKAEVGGAIIISAGGKEVGSKGRQLETRIKNEAARGGLRIIGPNCMGIVSDESKLNASFASHMLGLARKLGFATSWNREDHLYGIEIDLRSLALGR